ncbi:uncharacterized protein BYT42DRAFT_557080 [Radiomyces spectabilis]|uniref:uncharacterized protein n=1 Tax=Radiomyces spectabilis TaxID=64574 RepID=UPI00221F6D7D|nr:uncharacterized protein BYT42DRAFT_557080 [Radiomyces spectabilis]KAI8391501.1 hypothetical protein BYT42DRAFT_557080 [Radiomyces spectabilis]
MHFSKIVSSFHHTKEDESTPSSTATSPTPSLHGSEKDMLSISSKLQRFLRDPMRSAKTPDIVGSYYDPMGGRLGHCACPDPTNTGA